MYYTFKCTYCRRPFYTYDRNRANASVTLYRTVKKHLIDYNEDHKEHEMDDGEVEDSNQIYAEMTESPSPPAGGIQAFPLSAESIQPQKRHDPKPAHAHPAPKHEEKPKASETSNLHPSHTSETTFKISIILLLLLIIIIMGCIIFIPAFRENISLFIP